MTPLDGAMALLDPWHMILWIVGDDGEECTMWHSGNRFEVLAALSTGRTVTMRLHDGPKVFGSFEVMMPHVMGAFAGDSINIDDDGNRAIADGIYRLIEGGMLSDLAA